MKMLLLRNQAKYLIVFASALAMLLVVACGGGDEDFRDDPRSVGQSNDSNPENKTQDEFTDDLRVEDSSDSVASGDQVNNADAEGRLPGRTHGDRTHGIWPQVWSQHAPNVQSWEYKVNCGEASSHIEPCFLSDMTSVAVTTPSGEVIDLEKDFNTNEFSGEITRRWVLYGPPDGDLPEKGDYVFSYSRGAELVYEQAIPYDSGVVSYPTGVEWKRDGRDIVVKWNPPSEASKDMHYKALIWQVEDTPEVFISNVFDWDVDTAVLQDVPMIAGGKYSLNVALYFDDGYVYSEYVIFEWPEPGESGY
ncbi:MAG: hypothetical protein HOF01_00980 [Chloroflexi bacterium]|nr:hypothetical protein [Chloroflexota bacterium]